jgi:hypothetical protein
MNSTAYKEYSCAYNDLFWPNCLRRDLSNKVKSDTEEFSVYVFLKYLF